MENERQWPEAFAADASATVLAGLELCAWQTLTTHATWKEAFEQWLHDEGLTPEWRRSMNLTPDPSRSTLDFLMRHKAFFSGRTTAQAEGLGEKESNPGQRSNGQIETEVNQIARPPRYLLESVLPACTQTDWLAEARRMLPTAAPDAAEPTENSKGQSQTSKHVSGVDGAPQIADENRQTKNSSGGLFQNFHELSKCHKFSPIPSQLPPPFLMTYLNSVTHNRVSLNSGEIARDARRRGTDVV